MAKELFGKKAHVAPDDVAAIEQWLRAAEATIGKEVGKNDFKHDRLPKEQRKSAGIDISRRQYNKRFRLAVRLEQKMHRMAREQFKRSMTLASKNRLASRITWEDFSADLNTACLISYYVARCNLRSVFTNTSQVRPFDEICAALMHLCQENAAGTNWWAIAHVLPTPEVLRRLDDERKACCWANTLT